MTQKNQIHGICKHVIVPNKGTAKLKYCTSVFVHAHQLQQVYYIYT